MSTLPVAPAEARHTPKLPKLPSALRDFRELAWSRRGVLTVGLVLIVINRLAGLVLPGATKYLIDDVVQKRNYELLTQLAVAVGGAVLVQAVTSFLLTQTLSKSAQQLIMDLRIKVQQHIGRLPVRYYATNKTGALVSRIMSDVEGVRNLVGTGLVELIGGLLTAAVSLVLLLKINAPLTLLTFGFLALFGIILRQAFTRLRPVFRERGQINAEVTGRLTESLGGVRVVKGFHAEAREAEMFANGALRLFENVRRTLVGTSLVVLSSTLLVGVVSATVMIVGGRMILNGSMTVGDFVAYTLYLGFLVTPVFQIANIGSQITEAFAGLDRMHEVLTETPEDLDPQRTADLGVIQGEVRFDNVYFEYDPGKPVLRGVSLAAPPGSVTALVGSSGSGKSTLINLVAAFAKPTGGAVFVDGADLSTIRLDSYRSQLGVVLQENFLFDGTIRDNILFGRPAAVEAEVGKAAGIARVDEFAGRLEDGYNTIIGERGIKLSGGQRQRIAIARAILANPRILILDEATSSLDTESEALIQIGLASLMRGRTTFVIAHRLSTIRNADRILVLEDGMIVEQGTHDELIKQAGRYFSLYTRQAGFEANRFVNPGEVEPEPAVDSDNAQAAKGQSASVMQILRS